MIYRALRFASWSQKETEKKKRKQEKTKKRNRQGRKGNKKGRKKVKRTNSAGVLHYSRKETDKEK